MSIDNVPQRLGRELEITGGALVVSVSPGSLAEEAGIRGQQDQAGFFDIILAANGKRIDVYQDMVNILKDLKSGQSVVIKLARFAVDPQSGRLAMDPQTGKVSKSIGYTSMVKP